QYVDDLKNGGWEGDAANAFYDEMDNEVLPTLSRLTEAFFRAVEDGRQVGYIFQEAEEEAGMQFSVGDVGIFPTNNTPSNGAGNAGNAPLTQGNVNRLFTPANMDNLIGSSFRGEDSARLNTLMERLHGNPTGAELDKTLNEMATIRGIPREQFRQQYDKFLEVRAEANQISGGKPDIDPSPTVNELFHGDFLGSTASLRYGQVVGDAFGIDPIFGSLLNPTGGMVGPGNWAFNPDDDSPLGYHGIVHDAAGYLYNYHDTGPGYNYLGLEDRSTSNPMTGQQSGTRYWYEKLEPGLATQVKFGVGDALIGAGEFAMDQASGGIEAVIKDMEAQLGQL
ncbi:MAG: WXG100 family type VII secretion target, partial [Methylococcales bacterium]|nr:WXG100 family type VII secretion target [Methylococcales bacterium]